MNPQSMSSEQVRDDFIPKDAYFSREFAFQERERLWPRVWQVACRLEEIPDEGDFATYDILDDSIIVVRSDSNTIRAFHNVCPHRGRRLTEGCGRATQFVCRFHGWKWNRQGENIHVVDREDWGGCLHDDDIRLKEVLVDTWGGFVFINMDPAAKPLADFLEPIASRCGKFRFEDLRYKWYRTVHLNVNWKVALETFSEGYHTQQAHPQLMKFQKDNFQSAGYGRHGAFWVPKLPPGASRYGPSDRTGLKPDSDVRTYLMAMVDEYYHQLDAMITERSYEAAKRVMAEVSADASGEEVAARWNEFRREAAAREGIEWPEYDPQYHWDSHIDWHLFPNSVFLHGFVDGVLWYRARPEGDDPNRCIFDIWSLQRYGPGKEPPLKRETYDKIDSSQWGRIFMQDFVNIPEVHRGMKSRAFVGARPNPVQERAVSNFHRALRETLAEDMNH